MKNLCIAIALGFAGFSLLVNFTFATTPVVTVTTPSEGAHESSPVNFSALASSPECAGGIAAIQIYASPGDIPYTVNADQLDVDLNLSEGTYSAVVQAWDNCGGVGNATVAITVSGMKLSR